MENNRDRLAMACSVGDRYRELGGDAVASPQTATMLERRQEVEEASLARNRTRCIVASDEYRRCQASGIASRGFHVVAR